MAMAMIMATAATIVYVITDMLIASKVSGAVVGSGVDGAEFTVNADSELRASKSWILQR